MVLQESGTDITAIQKALPDKTVTDIRLAFERYSRLAAEKMEEGKNLEEDSAINQWIRLVKKTHEKYTGVVDIIPRVLKYIALFEQRPNDKEVNLRDCYLTLSEMTNGMICKKLNPATNHFLFENLSRLALKIKNQNNSKKKQFIRNMKNWDHIFKPQIIKTYNRRKNKANVVINPLNIPDDLLKGGQE